MSIVSSVNICSVTNDGSCGVNTSYILKLPFNETIYMDITPPQCLNDTQYDRGMIHNVMNGLWSDSAKDFEIQR